MEYERIKEIIGGYMYTGQELDGLDVELYNHEENFNNTDVERGQRCMTLDEIHQSIEKAKQELWLDNEV